MRAPDVLIIANQRATEVDGVIDFIRSRGLSVERINLCQYPEQLAFTWTPSSPTEIGQGIVGRSGWFHDPGQYSITRSLEGHGRELALREASAFWEGAALAAPCSWLNSPNSLILSSRKLYQLSRARELGIRTPATLISNDRKAVLSFFENFGGAVVKSLGNGYSVYGKENLKLYSRYYPSAPEELLEGLAFSPMIFQGRVPKKRELRVTVVEDECFGLVADTSDLNGNEVDLRRLDYDAERFRFSGMTVPAQVAAASLAITESLGLAYAGLDWIEDEHEQWLFLEINCMGAFKWSELCGAGDITTAIAEALIRRATRND